MRKSLVLVGIPVAAVGVAIAVAVGTRSSANKPAGAFADDLQRAQAVGLELAQSQGANKYALSETAPEAKPDVGKITRKGAGPQAIRSAAPTVSASPEATVAEVVEEMPQVQIIQIAAAPTPTEVSAPAIPRPVPSTQPYPDQNDGPILAGGMGRGTGRTGSGGGGGMGGIFGVIIRGGGVDGDNCDPRGHGPSISRPAMRTPVYAPNPGSSVGGSSVGRPSFGTPGGPVQARTRGGR